MKNFQQMGIAPILTNFTGDKIKIDRLLNRQIIIHDYKIEASKFEKGSGRCLQLQIELNNTKHVVFTGSTVLMNMINRVEKNDFPFMATIVKDNEYYEFR